MNVVLAVLIGMAIWIVAVFATMDPYVVIMAPFIVSAVVLVCCLLPRKRAPGFNYTAYPVPPGKP